MSEEAELVAAAQAGDEDAFAALYQAHVRYVRAVGRSILRTDDLDDLCQDTFLLAFTRLGSFAGTAGFRTWITRIAINQCLLALRRGRNGARQVQMDFEAMEDDVAFRTRDVLLEDVPARLDLERLLGMLRGRERQILEMACLEDRPDHEIAEILGVDRSTVKRTLTRTKERLRSFGKNR